MAFRTNSRGEILHRGLRGFLGYSIGKLIASAIRAIRVIRGSILRFPFNSKEILHRGLRGFLGYSRGKKATPTKSREHAKPFGVASSIRAIRVIRGSILRFPFNSREILHRRLHGYLGSKTHSQFTDHQPSLRYGSAGHSRILASPS
jgi:hypothetical protein